jgi:excisionase family DNA binding protein
MLPGVRRPGGYSRAHSRRREAGTRARREPAGGARGRPIYGRPPGGAASGSRSGPLLGFGLSKIKMKIATGELRSIKDGKYRRILPEWVDEYVQTQVDRQKAA